MGVSARAQKNQGTAVGKPHGHPLAARNRARFRTSVSSLPTRKSNPSGNWANPKWYYERWLGLPPFIASQPNSTLQQRCGPRNRVGQHRHSRSNNRTPKIMTRLNSSARIGAGEIPPTSENNPENRRGQTLRYPRCRRCNRRAQPLQTVPTSPTADKQVLALRSIVLVLSRAATGLVLGTILDIAAERTLTRCGAVLDFLADGCEIIRLRAPFH